VRVSSLLVALSVLSAPVVARAQTEDVGARELYDSPDYVEGLRPGSIVLGARTGFAGADNGMYWTVGVNGGVVVTPALELGGYLDSTVLKSDGANDSCFYDGKCSSHHQRFGARLQLSPIPLAAAPWLAATVGGIAFSDAPKGGGERFGVDAGLELGVDVKLRRTVSMGLFAAWSELLTQRADYDNELLIGVRFGFGFAS
jgi:hypothetical protein